MDNKVNRTKDEISPCKIKPANITKSLINPLNKEKLLKSLKDNSLKNIENSNFANTIKNSNSKKLVINKKDINGSNMTFIAKPSKNINISNIK